jgi:hypothetical protein
VIAIGAQLGAPATHVPDWHVSGLVHESPSLHDAPSTFAGFEQTPVDVLHVPTSWHWSSATQLTGFAPEHAPDWQVSVWVQALPSVHDVPLAFSGFEQTPVEVLQVPTSWHWSCATHVTGFAPVQVPDWQASVCVHALPSLHDVPLAFSGFEQTPVDVLQVPASWHGSCATHVTGFAPEQLPD